jgi:hypothetical protein
MCGAIPPIPITFSWRGFYLSTGTNLPLPLPSTPYSDLRTSSSSLQVYSCFNVSENIASSCPSVYVYSTKSFEHLFQFRELYHLISICRQLCSS